MHAADEYYLLAGRPFPDAARYEGFDMHEDGIGMARTFALEFAGTKATATGPQRGFFAAVDGGGGCSAHRRSCRRTRPRTPACARPLPLRRCG